MSYYCKLCDETIKHSSKYKHNKTKRHINLKNAFICRYIIPNPDLVDVDETIRKYVDIYKRKYKEFFCVLFV